MSQLSNNYSDSNKDRDAILEELGDASAVCAICETILDDNDDLTIKNHDCIKPYGSRFKMKTYDGSHVRKTVVDGLEKLVQYRFASTDDNDDSQNSFNLQESNKSSTTDESFSEKLIQFVYEKPSLWNIKLQHFQRGNSKKQNLWVQISNCFSDKTDVKTLKSRWKNLCTTYARVKKTMQGKSGQAAEKKRKWMYFDMMTFLGDVDLDNQVTTSNVEESTSMDCAAAPDESISALSNFQNIPDISEVIGADEEFQDLRVYSNPNQKKAKKSSNNVQLLAAETLATAIQASTPVINFPTVPALPSPPPATQTSVFADLMELLMKVTARKLWTTYTTFSNLK